jgi:hypothetical protein
LATFFTIVVTVTISHVIVVVVTVPISHVIGVVATVTISHVIVLVATLTISHVIAVGGYYGHHCLDFPHHRFCVVASVSAVTLSTLGNSPPSGE